jgi:membrane-bound lytic murein transglycosylase D
MSDVNPVFPDSVYIDRLSRIPAVIEMPYNDIVRRYIDVYTGRIRSKVSYMLGVSNFYIPIFEEALDAYGLPLELKYLPVIESALNPSAVSRAGASGLWQFMLSTGRLYGLESNSLVDERRDPIKSTWAAARYLKDLYDIYKDWNLVIAAYNCGPGTINKAIKRANGATDYWEIYNYLPRETRGYVPSFIAANYVMTYYCDHNICPMDTQLPVDTDTIQISKRLHFAQIAAICHTDIDEIKSLNPQYKREIIPGNAHHSYTLRLPHQQLIAFINSGDAVYAYNEKALFKNRSRVEVKETPVASSRSSKKGSKGNSGGSTVNYKIKKGDTLSSIAKKYNVSVADVRQWNGLRGNSITAGKTLKIYR